VKGLAGVVNVTKSVWNAWIKDLMLSMDEELNPHCETKTQQVDRMSMPRGAPKCRGRKRET
jgi:hypothetical protein